MKSYDIKDMIGKTPVSIIGGKDDEEIIFEFSDGTKGKFFHYQDCCECVIVDDVNGNWDDLIGNPLIVVDERASESEVDDDWYESSTWTFYTFRGIGGSVDVKWHGSSNGYYSESVDFEMG